MPLEKSRSLAKTDSGPTEGESGRTPDFGLLEWSAEAASALGVQLAGGKKTTWGS